MQGENSMALFESMPVPRAVWKNALPSMAAMIMALVYNMADTFFIAQTHNAILVAAVSLAMPVFTLFMALGMVFGIGGTSSIARALGQGRQDYASKVCAFCFWSCVVLGALMTGGFLLFMDDILRFIGTGAETWEATKTYLTIVCCGGPFVIVAN